VLDRRTWLVVLLLVLTVGWLGACQAPERVGEEDGVPSRPANDDFAARVVLEGAGGTAVGSSVDATAEVGEPDHAGRPARHSVWWTWTAPAAGTASFDARGSEFDAVVGAYRGEALAGLTPVAAADGSYAGAGLVTFDVGAGEAVAIAVDGLAGDSGTVALAWTLDEPEPDPDPGPDPGAEPEPDPDPDPEVPFEGAFEPEALSFAGAVGGVPPASRAAVLTNVGDASGSFELATDRDWLSVTPAAGVLGAQSSAELSVAVGACTVEGSETGTVFVVDGASAAAIVVERACATPVALPTLDLVLERLYVTQSVPAQDSARPLAERVPLVAERPGLLRVFVTANEPNDARPIVRLHYRHGGGAEEVLDLSGPDGVPLVIDEGVLGQTFLAALPAEVVRPGLEAYVAVSLAGEAETGNNRYPATGYWVPDVVVVPDARFTLVPITYRGFTPAVGDGSAYLGLTERMFPLAGMDVEVRAPVTFTGDLDTGEGWRQLLQALTSLRVTDGSDRHYYGVVNPGYGGGIAGIAWLGYQPIAVGWHHLPSGAEVATHELGHNWGREHAPCGVSGEPGFPHPGGLTDVWGYDRGTGELKAPTLADIMSYCSPVWTSDYTYGGVLGYRATDGDALSGLAAPASTALLLASGRVDGDAVELDPLFALDGVPQPVEVGPFQLVGLAADGRELLRVSFAAAEVSLEHGRAFHLAIPVAAETAAGLWAVRVERDGRVLAERQVGIRASSATPAEVSVQPDGSVVIDWDAAAFAEILVRDGAGGPVLGRDRTGRLTVRPTGRELELLLSDGVTTERRTLRY
jgi:hypothetical protein